MLLCISIAVAVLVQPLYTGGEQSLRVVNVLGTCDIMRHQGLPWNHHGTSGTIMEASGISWDLQGYHMSIMEPSGSIMDHQGDSWDHQASFWMFME